MQARRTQSLSCPHVPWPASKHNDNPVQQDLNRDGHLSHSRWWKRCAATAQTERRGPSCLAHTPSEIQPIISLPDSPSRWSLTPAVIPTHCFFSFFPLRFSLSLLTRTQIPFTVSNSPTVLAGSGPDWRGKGGVGSGLRSSPSWDRARTNRASFTLCCYFCLSYLTHVYTHADTHAHTHTHTCYQALTSSAGSGRQCILLNTFPHSQCWIFDVVVWS